VFTPNTVSDNERGVCDDEDTLCVCLQAVHFTGDLSEGDIHPQNHSTPLTTEQQLLVRLQAVQFTGCPAAVYGLQAVHFTGDLSEGDIQPQPHSTPLTPEQQLRLARRRSALLSIPVACPQAAASGRNSSSSSGSGGGGLFGWMDAATQPWTPTGRPDPEPLNPKQVRDAVSFVF
jgi:hypothetical protein